MNVDFDALRAAIDENVRKAWTQPDREWSLRPGGGEVYLQERVLAKAQPFITADALGSTPKECIQRVLNLRLNLFGAYEGSWASELIKRSDEAELRHRLLDLLYGQDDLHDRLERFLAWSDLRDLTDEGKKVGINATVASYLLAVSNPREYAFCKPRTYNAAVDHLLGRDARPKNKVQRVVHCCAFYKAVLEFLTKECGLEDGNLLDVHSIFYLLLAKDGWEVPPPPGPGPGPSPDNWRDDLQEIYELLEDRHNVVLYGPPGTGKTYLTVELQDRWRKWQGEDAVHMVTFHPSYSYEDFIEGYRPAVSGTESVAGFALTPGVFRDCCEQARQTPDRRFLLVIDEINRGDVARIFGELITLIESDKRGRLTVVLPQSKDRFSVPANLYLLGTMNTADKSISLMDIAIRRRFRFKRFPPDPDVLTPDREYCAEVAGIPLDQLLIAINENLADRDRAIGHSYLLIRKTEQDPVEQLRRRFRHDIIPLVEEYFYARPDSMQTVLRSLVEADGTPSRQCFDEEDPQAFVNALRALIGPADDNH